MNISGLFRYSCLRKSGLSVWSPAASAPVSLGTSRMPSQRWAVCPSRQPAGHRAAPKCHSPSACWAVRPQAASARLCAVALPPHRHPAVVARGHHCLALRGVGSVIERRQNVGKQNAREGWWSVSNSASEASASSLTGGSTWTPTSLIFWPRLVRAG
jgi:hypothetical protein